MSEFRSYNINGLNVEISQVNKTFQNTQVSERLVFNSQNNRQNLNFNLCLILN